MRVLGALPGDLGKCLYGGDRDACDRVYFGYWLWPRLQHMLEELELLRPPVPPGPLGVESGLTSSLLQELVPVLLAPYLGNPEPQPNLPLEARLQTTIKFRDGLRGFVKVLDEEIMELKKFAKTKG